MAGFAVFHEDWSLYRKGRLDQQRHQEKIKDAIRKNLADIVAEESIILSDGKKVLKVPIRSLEEYRFRYDFRQREHAGQGQGGSKVGDIIARDGAGRGPGQGPGAGEQPGVDYYETEVTLEELEELIFEDLGLPNLRRKKEALLPTDTWRFGDVRRTGLMSNVDKRRTLLEALRRNAMAGRNSFTPLAPEDLRFRTWEEEIRRESQAAVLAMMDTSGSMGSFEKYIARSFFYWMVRFLRTKYQNVQIVFLAHHTEAREVTEQEFFTKGESGGTRCSSVYRLALEIIGQRFPPEDFNIYPFHFSDGDNLSSDNDRCVELIHALLEVSSAAGYGEIVSPHYAHLSSSTLMSVYQKVKDPRFVSVVIRDRSEVYPALRAFFTDRGAAQPGQTA